jgi:UDP-2,3-diacylglucosamine hydrolase
LQISNVEAPAHWRSIDIVSDLHLCEALPLTFRAFVDHLESTSADAVLILGDLFEVWVGDDQRHRPFEHTCVDALKRNAQRLWLGFMPGNRDFLVGPALLQAAGLHPLDDPTCLAAFGQRWLLTHGDALCLEDVEYQAFRRMVRGPAWQSDFLQRPFDERWNIASGIRSESRSRKTAAPDPSLWADVDRRAGLAWLAQADAHVLIHGHTHRPGDQAWDGTTSRSVLSDWDLDHANHRAEVLRLDASGLTRRVPEAAAERRTALPSA